MRTHGQAYEIVHVLDDSKLVDSEHYERRYSQAEGISLAKGYYIVTWPDPVRAGRFNGEAHWQGPYRRRPEARAALEGGAPEADLFALAESRPLFARRSAGQESLGRGAC